MVTPAALATINRVPLLLLPGDIYATAARDLFFSNWNTRWARCLGE